MNQWIGDLELSPYREFTKSQWATLRADTPMTLSEEEVKRLQSLNDPISIKAVEEIYLPLSRLLWLYVRARHTLYDATRTFLGIQDGKVPYIIGVAGSVAVGKSTTSRLLKALLARWPNTPKVDLITTDGFLFPNAALQRRNIMDKKGFPESFDLPTLLHFLSDIKAGKRHVHAPLYSHSKYDILEGQYVVIDQPDILIVEGLNVLQGGKPIKDGRAVSFVSDYFDFKIYIHAEIDVLQDWYVSRFMRLCETAFLDPAAYFHTYSQFTDLEAIEAATNIWQSINEPNLKQNILPTRPRADLIINKASNHDIGSVALRKL